jgi:hypothetical protein
MINSSWILFETVTTGITLPIIVVELAAQKMRGWLPDGPPFRRLLYPSAMKIPEAARARGYSKEILERDGEAASVVYRDFATYVDGLPMVAYNMSVAWDEVLLPEWERLSIEPIGEMGFCALQLTQRLLDPMPAANWKLQTLSHFYGLPDREAHEALGKVQTIADLFSNVLRPIAESRNISTWKAVCEYAKTQWYPSRIAFGKFKGRQFQDARTDIALMDWLKWLAGSTNANSAEMGSWYLQHLGNSVTDDGSIVVTTVQEHTTGSVGTSAVSTGIIVYKNPEVEQLRQMIATTRARLAELDARYTQERHAVDVTQSTLFKLVRVYYQARERLKLVVDFRSKFLKTLLHSGEDAAAVVADDYLQAKSESDAQYEQVASAADSRKALSTMQEVELQSLWKKLVRLYHPDRFANQPEKLDTYTKLTSVINKAREDADVALLCEIADDPHGFILRSGWTRLDFTDATEAKNLSNLLDTLQIEVVVIMEKLNDLHESAEFELHTISLKNPTLLEEVAAAQSKVIEAEIVLLRSKAEQLQAEIAELTGIDEASIGL